MTHSSAGQQLVHISAIDEPVLQNNLRLSDFVDISSVQLLMDEFYNFAHLTMAIVDINGDILVQVGFQKICANFHRVHPDSCRNCIESDSMLTVGVRPGGHRLYRCKNNMWDIATPLMVGDLHVGNISSGQFFFDDEAVDRSCFEEQARKYGFPKEDYLLALDAVPRVSREEINRAMAFISKLATIISEMGYSNFKLKQTIKDLKQSEGALIRSEKLASVGRLAATVAHEINNPLEAVTNCLFILKSNVLLPPELMEYLNLAERELERVAHMAKQTLGFYRESTKPQVIDLNKLVEEISSLYTSKLQAKEINLSFVPKKPILLSAVAGEIRQVISNLLANAIDASAKGGRILIRASKLFLKGENYVLLTMADIGCGIRRENLPQLFKPFFTTKESTGNGLGLWISQEIISKHGGRIRLRSSAGRGTVFSVFIPAATISRDDPR